MTGFMGQLGLGQHAVQFNENPHYPRRQRRGRHSQLMSTAGTANSPPPWLARIDHLASTVWPVRHTTPVGSRGSTWDPRSPCLLCAVSTNDSCVDTHFGPPPAIPQGSYTGAWPGARQGLKRYWSAGDSAFTPRLYVRKRGSLFVAVKFAPHRSRVFGFDSPPSQASQPILQPCEK